MIYPAVILSLIPLFFALEWFFRTTGLVVHRYYTATMYLYYIIILPLTTIILLSSPERWQLTAPIFSSLKLIGATTISFYIYASIRLLGFKDKARNKPEIYHHLIFAVLLSVGIFTPGYARILFVWLFLQQYSIITYYIDYIFKIKSKKIKMRCYLLHYYNFFIVKLVLLTLLFAYTCLNHTLFMKNPLWFLCDLVILIISFGFNITWFVQMTPKAMRYSKELKVLAY